MKSPFRQFRFSLTGLFVATLFVACAVATLRYTTRLWADATFTLALAVAALAALGAMLRTGAARAFWVGTLLGGGGYLFLAYGPWIGESVRPHLVTTSLLSAAQERMQAIFNQPIAFTWQPAPIVTSYPPQNGFTAGAPGSQVPYIPNSVGSNVPTSVPYDPYGPAAVPTPYVASSTFTTTAFTSDLPEWENLERASHSLTALLAALLFGKAARWFYGTRSSSSQTSEKEPRQQAAFA